MTLKDHLRSLSDKQPPDDPKKSADSAAATPSDSPSDAPKQGSTSLKGIADCLVTVTADGKTGKGFVVDGEGKIATNCQLVSAAGKIKVTTHSGDIIPGKVDPAGRDPGFGPDSDSS